MWTPGSTQHSPTVIEIVCNGALLPSNLAAAFRAKTSPMLQCADRVQRTLESSSNTTLAHEHSHRISYSALPAFWLRRERADGCGLVSPIT